MTETLRHIRVLGRRSVVDTMRQPVMIFPAIFFPLAFLVVIAGGGDRASQIPGFPAESYFAIALAGAFIQGTMLSGVNSGSKLAFDIETGFLDRLVMTPVNSSAILVGHLVGSLAVSMLQLVVFLAAGLIGGVHIKSGLLGIPVMFVLALAVAVAFSAAGVIIGVRSGSAEKVQGVFPLFFIVMIFSSYMIPRPLMQADWFRWVATVNPASYLIEGVRSLVVIGWDGGCDRGAHDRGSVGEPPAKGGVVVSEYVAAARAVMHRNLVAAIRLPALAIQPIVAPTVFLIAFGGGLSAFGDIPGFSFPSGYVSFQFAFIVLQAGLFNGVFLGVTLARDLELGFAHRLMLAMRHRSALIAGYVLAAVVRAVFVIAALVGVGFLVGMRVDGSLLQMAGLLVFGILMSVIGALYASGIALRFKTIQAAPVMFMPSFLALFLTPLLVPFDLLTGWVKAVARYNPLTYMLNAGRGFISGLPNDTVLAFGLAAAAVAVAALFAMRSLRRAEAGL